MSKRTKHAVNMQEIIPLMPIKMQNEIKKLEKEIVELRQRKNQRTGTGI